MWRFNIWHHLIDGGSPFGYAIWIQATHHDQPRDGHSGAPLCNLGHRSEPKGIGQSEALLDKWRNRPSKVHKGADVGPGLIQFLLRRAPDDAIYSDQARLAKNAGNVFEWELRDERAMTRNLLAGRCTNASGLKRLSERPK
jgi:hypothetical protein